METKISDILIDMSVIIGNYPELWTKKSSARDVYGDSTQVGSIDAASWCTWGFLQEYALLDTDLYNKTNNYRLNGLHTTREYSGNITIWNDKPETTAKIVSKKLLEEAEYFLKQGK